MRSSLALLATSLAVFALAPGCGGDDGGGGAGAPSGEGAAAAPEAPAPELSAQDSADLAMAARLPAGVTPQMVRDGRKLFVGPAGCQTCHGADARGTALAPSLRDDEWLNVDGGYESIVRLVEEGVPDPKEYPAFMPARGGFGIDDAQLRAVSAYVYAVSHGLL
ncbi:MAG: cytochrome c [Gemmatimonadota bacterium]